MLNPKAFEQIVKRGQINFVQDERIVELAYMAVYMPLVLESGDRYVLSIPYFTRGEELNKDILLIVIIAVNIAMIVGACLYSVEYRGEPDHEIATSGE